MSESFVRLGTILVVEDDETIRSRISTLLQSLGYDVTSAEDGLVAVTLIKRQHFDLVITDLDMPNVDGIDLLETIKATELDTDVLLVSGAGSIGTAVLAIKLGAVNFLEKPLEEDQIKAEVRQIFRARKERALRPPGDADEPPRPRRPSRPTPAIDAPGAARPASEAKIGRYLVTRKIGEGGMAQVYECFDPVLRRVVAVKVLDTEQAAELGNRQLYLERFRREAQSAGQLVHPNIATIFDFGEDPEREALYLAMELVDGRPLRKLITTGGPLAVERAVRIVFQTADGLEFAHRRGIVHRDVKPPNILVGEGDTAKILDFGVAKVHNSDLTDSGIVVGSVAYMAPEILQGHPMDHRADQFALGHTLFEMLTGKVLFSGRDFADVAKNVLNYEPPSLAEMGVAAPVELQLLLSRLLSKTPDLRYPDEMELLTELMEIGRSIGVWLDLAVPRTPDVS